MNNQVTVAALLCELRQNIAENKYAVPWDASAKARAEFLIQELARRGHPDSQVDLLIEQANLDAIHISTNQQLLNEIHVSSGFARFGGVSMRDLHVHQLIVDELVRRGVSKERISIAAETGEQDGIAIAASMSRGG